MLSSAVARRAGIAVVGASLVLAAMVGAKAYPVRESTPQPRRGPSQPPASPGAPVGVVDRQRLLDGEYLGAVFPNRYGPVQVAVTIRRGQLVDVTPVQLPTAAARGIEIGRRAAPKLRAQAIERQSADVDTVSGATYTSDGYRKSLQSAIDAARTGRRAR